MRENSEPNRPPRKRPRRSGPSLRGGRRSETGDAGNSESDLEELIRRCRSRDRDAADLLYRRYAGLVRHIVRQALSPALRRRYDSTDLQQSLFATVLQDLPDLEYRGEREFETWLRTATRNKVNYRRRGFVGPSGQPRESELPEDPDGAPRSRSPGPSESVELADDVERLHAILDSLPREKRELVLLVTLEHVTFAEAAARLGIGKPDAARMRYVRALVEIAEAWPTA